jgi:hypothetical protein
MPEGGSSNIEVVRHLSAHHSSSVEHRILETVEAIVFAIIAITLPRASTATAASSTGS